MAMTITEVVARMRSRIRDASGNTFDDAVLQEAVRAGIRNAFPRLFTIQFIDLGIVSSGVSSATGFTVPEGAVIHAVEYKAGSNWLGLPGFRVVGDTVEFQTLGRARQMRLLLLVPIEVPDALDADIPLSNELLDAIEDLGVATVLDAYLAGRVPYDKFTTSTSDDAITPYEVQMAARHLRERADVRLRELGMPKPIVRAR